MIITNTNTRLKKTILVLENLDCEAFKKIIEDSSCIDLSDENCVQFFDPLMCKN